MTTTQTKPFENAFEKNADQLKELFHAGDINATINMLYQTLFESVVSNMAEVEKRLKNASDKEYSKIFYAYNNLSNQSRNFFSEIETLKANQVVIDEMREKASASINRLIDATGLICEAHGSKLEDMKNEGDLDVEVIVNDLRTELINQIHVMFYDVRDVVDHAIRRTLPKKFSI